MEVTQLGSSAVISAGESELATDVNAEQLTEDNFGGGDPIICNQ